jgi:AraC-like DNA-binding protein
LQRLESGMPSTARSIDAVASRGLPSAAGILTRLACIRVREAGIRLEPLLRKAGLTLAQIEDRSIRIHAQRQIRFLELAADALQDPFLGFHLARDSDLREAGLFHYVLASSDTLEEALQRAARYSTTLNDSISLECVERHDLVVVFAYVGIARHSDRHQIEFWTTSLVRACRELTGRYVLPHRIQLTHRCPEDCSELNTYLGCDVEFGAPVDEVAFPATIKNLPVIGADSYLNDLLIGYCEEALNRRSTSTGHLRSTVENAIAPLLPHGKARASEVARKLGMSQRTLARHLAAERLTFAKVLDELRADLAQRHLRDANLSISQVAWLLGYQEVSAFTHAFKRWTGTTPREMRARAA